MPSVALPALGTSRAVRRIQRRRRFSPRLLLNSHRFSILPLAPLNGIQYAIPCQALLQSSSKTRQMDYNFLAPSD